MQVIVASRNFPEKAGLATAPVAATSARASFSQKRESAGDSLSLAWGAPCVKSHGRTGIAPDRPRRFFLREPTYREDLQFSIQPVIRWHRSCKPHALSAATRSMRRPWQSARMNRVTEQAQTKLIDRFGRHVTYVRLSVTDRCDLRCIYCMSERMTFLPRQQLLTLEEIARLGHASASLASRNSG